MNQEAEVSAVEMYGEENMLLIKMAFAKDQLAGFVRRYTSWIPRE